MITEDALLLLRALINEADVRNVALQEAEESYERDTTEFDILIDDPLNLDQILVISDVLQPYSDITMECSPDDGIRIFSKTSRGIRKTGDT